MQSMKSPDPLVTGPRVGRRSIFTIIGMIVVGLIAAVVVYFAYTGWALKGKPTPDVEITTQPAK